jgi:photosystem II stability/assembly factor-like uncharacterized protein
MRFIAVVILVLSCHSSLCRGAPGSESPRPPVEGEQAAISREPETRPFEAVQGGFRSFSIVSPHNVWAIGTEGDTLGDHASVILRSSDGGKSWTRKLALPNDHLFDIYFLNNEVGWVAGALGVLLKTTDGGARWERQNVPTQSNLNKIQFVDSQYGWISGFDGELLRTENGGYSWRSHKLRDSGWAGDRFKGFISSLDFSDKLHGWIVGELGQVYRSTDGGVSWRSQGAALAKLIGDLGAMRVDFFDVKFFTRSRGFIVAQASKANRIDSSKRLVVFQTKTGGESWTVLKSFKEPGLVRAQFIGPSEFWIESRYGRSLHHTRNAGKTWTTVAASLDVNAPLLYFIDSSEGWMVSALDGFSGLNLYTADGGKTWVERRVHYTVEQAKR